MKYHVLVETQEGKELKSWGILPVLGTTKILDGVYDPESKIIRLLMDSVTERYTDFQVQDPKTKKVSIQQRKLETYYKANILEEDIEFFLNTYVENNFKFESEKEIKIDV